MEKKTSKKLKKLRKKVEIKKINLYVIKNVGDEDGTQ